MGMKKDYQSSQTRDFEIYIYERCGHLFKNGKLTFETHKAIADAIADIGLDKETYLEEIKDRASRAEQITEGDKALVSGILKCVSDIEYLRANGGTELPDQQDTATDENEDSTPGTDNRGKISNKAPFLLAGGLVVGFLLWGRK